MPRGGATKSPLNRRLIKAVSAEVLTGGTPYAAAGKFGYARTTVINWLGVAAKYAMQLIEERGEEGFFQFLTELAAVPERDLTYEQLCLEFAQAVEVEAEGSAELDAAQRVFKSSALQWLQSNPRMRHWQKRTQVELDGALHHSGSVQIDAPVNHRTLAEMMVLMQEMGIVQPGPQLGKLLEYKGNGDGEDGAVET